MLVTQLLGCTGSGASAQCKDVCKRDAECFEKQDDEQKRAYKFDRDECEATCAALERDGKGQTMVEAHARCVAAAGDSCRDVRECP